MILGDSNSRIHNDIGGEGEVFGPYCFGNPGYNPEERPDANRELLIELCASSGMCVANTFKDSPAEHQITFHDVFQNPMAPITHKGFAQLDLVLCPYDALWQIRNVRSDRRQALATHHFHVEVVVETAPERKSDSDCQIHKKARPYDLNALSNPRLRETFVARTLQLEENGEIEGSSVQQIVEKYCDLLHNAAAEVLPKKIAEPKKPWISTETLLIISGRDEARKGGDREREVFLNKNIRQSARKD